MKQSAQEALAEEVAKCYHDPLRFVQMMYPWREPGFLQPYDGPDVWQREFLMKLGKSVKERGFTGQMPGGAYSDGRQFRAWHRKIDHGGVDCQLDYVHPSPCQRDDYRQYLYAAPGQELGVDSALDEDVAHP